MTAPVERSEQRIGTTLPDFTDVTDRAGLATDWPTIRTIRITEADDRVDEVYPTRR